MTLASEPQLYSINMLRILKLWFDQGYSRCNDIQLFLQHHTAGSQREKSYYYTGQSAWWQLLYQWDAMDTWYDRAIRFMGGIRE